MLFMISDEVKVLEEKLSHSERENSRLEADIKGYIQIYIVDQLSISYQNVFFIIYSSYPKGSVLIKILCSQAHHHSSMILHLLINFYRYKRAG